MSSDGSIIIDTRLDTSGINKGTANLKSSFGKISGSLKKIGGLIASVFAVQKIVQFGAEASKAAMEFNNAMLGLQSVLEGQGKSFTAAQEFINEYTEDGLIPATNAITAYKNLALRGYDDSQIRQVMTALKDASAFGRSASLSMGEAVQTATEGLKNENSVLVDNAGVTKNVAKMWDEYAKSIGTTANNLTQQQKIQAEVLGIMEESKYQTGDAAKVAYTLSGQLQQLSYGFNNLKIAVGNAINPILESVLPIINTAINGLTKLANSIATVVSLIFGKVSVASGGLAAQNEAIADSAYEGAAAEDVLADATEAAGKAAKKAQANFDELNVLKTDSGGSGGSSVSSGVTSGNGTSNSITVETKVEDEISPQLKKIAETIKRLFEPFEEFDLDPLKKSLKSLGKGFGELGVTIGDALEWVWFDILVPLSEWVIEEAAPESIEMLSEAFGALSELLDPVIEGLDALLNSLTPIIDFVRRTAILVLQKIQSAFSSLSEVFNEKGTVIVGIFENIGEACERTWQIIGPIFEVLLTATELLLDYLIEEISIGVGLIIDTVYGLTEFLLGVATFDMERAMNGLRYIAESNFKAMELSVESFSEIIRRVCEELGITAKDIVLFMELMLIALDQMTGLPLSNIIKKFIAGWGQIETSTKNIWREIPKIIKAAVNSMISYINGMISSIVNGINSVISALNRVSFTIPNWMPLYGGKKVNFSIGYITAPQIPYLAKGAVIPPNAPFMAMLGDQKNGTNIEAPLETIKQALAEVMASNEAGEINVNIVFEGELAQLGRILKPVIDTENHRRGGSLAKGAVIVSG